MRRRIVRWIVAGTVPVLVLSACSSVVDGTGSANVAAHADLKVFGDSHNALDTRIKDSISDVTAFWKINYPSVSGGKPLKEVKALYSIDGAHVVTTGELPAAVTKNVCAADRPAGIVDNAKFCGADDSILWDRSPHHLVDTVGSNYGPLLVALVFAHEYGHAIQFRLGYFDDPKATSITIESQADCAAGAYLAYVLKGKAAHIRATSADVDAALQGYLLVRDPPPGKTVELDHGNGFDRIAALADGIKKGPTFCYARSYFDRTFTERAFVTDDDYTAGGNETLDQVLNANDPSTDNTAGGLQPDLNRFWKAKAATINKTWQDVKIAQANHPKCGVAASSQFGYCPDDNTVYYSNDFAKQAYYSLVDLQANRSTAELSVKKDAPADFALGTLFAVGWGMAVRSKLLGKSVDGADALLAASCYVGAYARDVNKAPDQTPRFLLSPPDMDEATSAMIALVGQDKAFGARGTTAIDRVEQFVKGYNGGLSVC